MARAIVYCLVDGTEVVYVGSSSGDARFRVYAHRRNGKRFTHYFSEKCKESERYAREAELIAQYKPKCNSAAVLLA